MGKIWPFALLTVASVMAVQESREDEFMPEVIGGCVRLAGVELNEAEAWQGASGEAISRSGGS